MTMHKNFTKEDIFIGISACLIGEKVRFAAWNRGRTAPDWWVQAIENIAE